MRWLHFALAGALLAQPAETVKVRIDGRTEVVRKINGRWWSETDHELTRTGTSWIWVASGGNAHHLVRFDHHNPVDPSRVQLLDRSMGPDGVRRVLGPPNSVFPADRPERQQTWHYYGPGGYKLALHFSGAGGIFTAKEALTASSRSADVPHLSFRSRTLPRR